MPARTLPGNASPFYGLQLPNYVSVVAESRKNVILVKQYRPAIDRTTTELPSGRVDPATLARKAVKRRAVATTTTQIKLYQRNAVNRVAAPKLAASLPVLPKTALRCNGMRRITRLIYATLR